MIDPDEKLFENGSIIIDQYADLGGGSLHLTGQIDLFAVTAKQRETVLALLDMFAQLGRTRRSPVVRDLKDEG